MGKDIQPLLDGWPYDPGKLCVRKIKGADGREKIQLRIEMGILQMEISDRPDGQRPHGYESLLTYYQAQAADKSKKNEEFSVDVETCMMLQLEALQYYHRRISFLELEDYERAKRDAERNLSLFDFVKEYASDDEDKIAFEQNRPFVIGHRVRASGLLKLESDDYALTDIEEGIEEIQSLFTEFDRPDLMDDSEEVEFLREWANEIRQDRPRSLKQDLSDQLKEAVAIEDFEKAAELRDRITEMAKAGKN